MIHVFHGFLGSPADFEFLKGDGVILHNLYTETPVTKKDDILIGYSMGGRLAMDLAKKNGFKKLILINANPGIDDGHQMISQVVFEDIIIGKLKNSPEEFLSFWNSMRMFEADRPVTNIPDGSLELYERMRLSRQEYYLPFLEANKSRVHWIIGEKDLKYTMIANNLLKDFDVHWVPGGHRLFQHPDLLLPIIQKIIA